MLRKTKGYFGMNSRYNFRGCVEDFIYKRFRCLTQSTVSRSFVEVPALNVFDHVMLVFSAYGHRESRVVPGYLFGAVADYRPD